MQWVSFRMTLDIRLSAMVCDGSVLWKCKRVMIRYPTQGEVMKPLLCSSGVHLWEARQFKLASS